MRIQSDVPITYDSMVKAEQKKRISNFFLFSFSIFEMQQRQVIIGSKLYNKAAAELRKDHVHVTHSGTYLAMRMLPV